MTIVRETCAIAALALMAAACGGSTDATVAPKPTPVVPVVTAPSIVQQPQNATVTVGQTATFHARAEGTAPLTYQWKKNDVAIAGAVDTVFTTPPATASDSGAAFTFVVTNSASSATSGAARLTVLPLPRVALQTLVGAGVQGAPTQGSQAVTVGSTIDYSFKPTVGFSEAIVLIDGVAAPASGTITMTTDHLVWAYGNPASGTRYDKMTSVPSDFTQIPYPAFYANRPSAPATVTDPRCAITSPVVAYPTSYLGDFPLPAVQGAPLAPSIRRGANGKDAWRYPLTNPPMNDGCSGDLHVAFIATLKRFKALGVDHVDISNFAIVADANAATPVIDPKTLEYQEADLAWIAGQAGALGMTVHEYLNIGTFDVKGVRLPATPTAAWRAAFLDAYTQFVQARAASAQTVGLEALQLDWGDYKVDWTANQALYIQKMTAAGQAVRRVFSGKTILGSSAPGIADAGLMANVDWYGGNLSSAIQLTDAQNAKIDVPLLKQRYLNYINFLSQGLGSNKRPVVWKIFIQSRRDFYVNNFVEDEYCVSGCIQNSIQTDFSVQAIGYEAALEAIAAQTQFITVSVDAAASWYVDVMLPSQSFPNLSQSWRNKPAESILYKWFGHP